MFVDSIIVMEVAGVGVGVVGCAEVMFDDCVELGDSAGACVADGVVDGVGVGAREEDGVVVEEGGVSGVEVGDVSGVGDAAGTGCAMASVKLQSVVQLP